MQHWWIKNFKKFSKLTISKILTFWYEKVLCMQLLVPSLIVLHY